MNERIRELAGQALDQAVPQTWTTLTAYDLNKFTEVFAELIVQECVNVLHDNELHNRHISHVLREHFGVK